MWRESHARAARRALLLLRHQRGRKGRGREATAAAVALQLAVVAVRHQREQLPLERHGRFMTSASHGLQLGQIVPRFVESLRSNWRVPFSERAPFYF